MKLCLAQFLHIPPNSTTAHLAFCEAIPPISPNSPCPAFFCSHIRTLSSTLSIPPIPPIPPLLLCSAKTSQGEPSRQRRGGGSLAAAPRCEAPAYARTNWGKPRFPPDPYPGGLCHHQSSMQALEMKPMKNTCDRPPRAMNESLIPAFSFCRQEAFRKKHKPPRGF